VIDKFVAGQNCVTTMAQFTSVVVIIASLLGAAVAGNIIYSIKIQSTWIYDALHLSCWIIQCRK
jgi:hypothetical protein